MAAGRSRHLGTLLQLVAQVVDELLVVVVGRVHEGAVGRVEVAPVLPEPLAEAVDLSLRGGMLLLAVGVRHHPRLPAGDGGVFGG